MRRCRSALSAALLALVALSQYASGEMLELCDTGAFSHVLFLVTAMNAISSPLLLLPLPQPGLHNPVAQT
jgi:hypothetical protein